MRTGSRRSRSTPRRSSGSRCSGATSPFRSPTAPCLSTSTIGRASRHFARTRRRPSRPTSPIASHIGNTRDRYAAPHPALPSRSQVQGPVRRGGDVPGPGHAERGTVQPALDRPRRGCPPVRRGRQPLCRSARRRGRGEPRICPSQVRRGDAAPDRSRARRQLPAGASRGAGGTDRRAHPPRPASHAVLLERSRSDRGGAAADRKSTRVNSSHLVISYAVFCLKKKKKKKRPTVDEMLLTDTPKRL